MNSDDIKQQREIIRTVVKPFIEEAENSFLSHFSLSYTDFGRELSIGDRTGAIDWYAAESGTMVGNAAISVGCKTRIEAEVEKMTDALLAPHAVYAMNEDITRVSVLSTSKTTLKSEVNTATSQQAGSRIWVAIITFEIESFIGI